MSFALRNRLVIVRAKFNEAIELLFDVKKKVKKVKRCRKIKQKILLLWLIRKIYC